MSCKKETNRRKWRQLSACFCWFLGWLTLRPRRWKQRSSETSDSIRTIRRYNPRKHTLHSHPLDDLKSNQWNWYNFWIKFNDINLMSFWIAQPIQQLCIRMDNRIRNPTLSRDKRLILAPYWLCLALGPTSLLKWAIRTFSLVVKWSRREADQCHLKIIIIIIRTALEPFVGPWPLFQLLDPVHSR
jgi:hypothetical protein